MLEITSWPKCSFFYAMLFIIMLKNGLLQLGFLLNLKMSYFIFVNHRYLHGYLICFNFFVVWFDFTHHVMNYIFFNYIITKMMQFFWKCKLSIYKILCPQILYKILSWPNIGGFKGSKGVISLDMNVKISFGFLFPKNFLFCQIIYIYSQFFLPRVLLRF